MFPLLAIPLALGYLLARRCLGRTTWPALWGETIALAVVSSLIGVNGIYRQLGTSTYHGYNSLDLSVMGTLLIQLLLIAGLLWKAPKGSPLEPLPKVANIGLAILSLVVLIYTNAQQIANPDDDYWIHAPLQGLMRHGNFPPFNPFFSDIAMNGHYGRNLSIVTFSWLSGCDVFLSQHWVTSALQVVTLWLFFSAFTQSSVSWRSGLLATVFVYFGINAGGRGGLIDTMQNNNPYVHLYLALLLSLMMSVWKDSHGRWATVLAGLTLGSYAIVYETHFGLVFLSILSVTPLLWLRSAIDKRVAIKVACLLALSLPLAFTQGGPLTDILERKQSGREHSQAEVLSKGMQNQAQVVKVTFPKAELFQILLETGEYQRVAHIYTLDTPLRWLHTPTTERGYAYIWSWDVLKIHFLPLYLFPFSLIILWRRKSLAGHFMGAFGTISFLVPALVNFGPIYESEYYRWQFAASLGFAGALGLALGALLESSSPTTSSPFVWRNPRLVISARGYKALLIALLTLVNSWACLHFVAGRLAASLPRAPSAWLYFPSTQNWLSQHQVLDFTSLDYEAADWLSRQVKPGDRLLTNFQQENNFSILYESTLTGLTGARCVGHALPLEDEKIGTTPFRRAPAAIAFWQTFKGDPLSQLGVDWVFYRNDRGEELPPLPGAALVHRSEDGQRLRLVYKIDRALLPDVGTAPDPGELPSGTPVARFTSIPKVLRGGRLSEMSVVLPSLAENESYSGVLELSTVRRSDGLRSSPSENLRWRLTGRGETLKLPFVPPYDEGVYDLHGSWLADQDSPALAFQPIAIDVAFSKLLAQIEIASMDYSPRDWGPLKTWPSRVMITPEVTFRRPDPWPQDDDVLACWAFYSPQREEFDLLPGVNLQRISLSQAPVRLPLVTPERPGTYRLALYLSAGQGELVRIPTGQVIVEERR